MSYRIVLDGVMDTELVRLFGATQELAARASGLLVNTHGVLSSANLLAQGGDTSTGGTTTGGTTTGGGTTTTGGGDTTCVPSVGHPCPNEVGPHDPYLVVLGAGAAIGLVVGLVAGIMIGKAQSGSTK